MNSSFDEVQQIGAVAALLAASAWCAQAAFGARAQDAAVAGSDDPLPALRTSVYTLLFARRQSTVASSSAGQ
jgi:hypothetical protein